MRRIYTFCVAAAVWSALASTAWCDGVWMDGISARSLGRGGTNQGFADNGGIIFDNPAAMTNVQNNGLFEGDLIGLQTNFRYMDATRNRVSSGFTPTPQLAYIRKSADGNWAIGVGMFTPAGFSTNYDMGGPPAFAGPRAYDSFGMLTKVLPAISYRATDRLSIGATYGVGISYASLNGPYFLQTPPPPLPPGFPTLLDIHGGGATQVWSVGLQYLLTDDTTIGATYQSASTFNLHGSAEITPFGSPIGTRYESTIHIKWPQTVALGMRHKLCPHRTIAADAVWYDWSSSFNQIDVTLQDPAVRGFPPTLVEHLPLNWRDSVSMRLGYEQILDLGGTFRLGYVYHRNPIPAATATPFLPAFLTNMFTVGYGFAWNQWNVDVGWAHAFAPNLSVGTSSIAGGDFSNSTMHAQVDALFIGMLRKF